MKNSFVLMPAPPARDGHAMVFFMQKYTLKVLTIFNMVLHRVENCILKISSKKLNNIDHNMNRQLLKIEELALS